MTRAAAAWLPCGLLALAVGCSPRRAVPLEAAPIVSATSTPAEGTLVELYTKQTPGGAVTAHFMGHRVELTPGEPVPPASFGVERLEISFHGDPQRYVVHPSGELFFSDWSFEVFSPEGTYAALPQDRFGPYRLVKIDRLKAYLRGSAPPDEVVAYWPNPQGFTPVHGNLRWISETEVEFEAQGETTWVVRHALGGKTVIVGARDGGTREK